MAPVRRFETDSSARYWIEEAEDAPGSASPAKNAASSRRLNRPQRRADAADRAVFFMSQCHQIAPAENLPVRRLAVDAPALRRSEDAPRIRQKPKATATRSLCADSSGHVRAAALLSQDTLAAPITVGEGG